MIDITIVFILSMISRIELQERSNGCSQVTFSEHKNDDLINNKEAQEALDDCKKGGYDFFLPVLQKMVPSSTIYVFS